MTTRHVFSGQRGLIFAILVCSLFVNLLILTAPLYMIQLFSRVVSSGSVATLVALSVGAGIALIFFFFFDAIRQRLVARLGTRLEARLGPTVLRGVLSATSATDTMGAQPLRDLQEVRGFVTSPAFIALLDAPWSVIFIAAIFLFHPLLGVIAVLGIGLLFLLGVLSNAFGRAPNQAAEESTRSANSTVEEMIRNAEVIRAMGKQRALIERWSLQSFGSMMFGMLATDRVALMTSFAKLVRMGLQIAIMGVGVLLVLEQKLTPGLMIASSILLGRAAAPVEQSIAGWRGLMTARTAVRRLNGLLARQQGQAELMELPEPEGLLSVENATVVMPNRQEPLLLDVNFALQPGQSLGLIGPSGAGKTTLVRVLVGLQPLVRGNVRIDAAAISDWPEEQLGQYIGFLPQRVELFNGTIAENIALMDGEAEPAKVVAAARLAQVHDMILKLPGGYNAPVGMRGELLSAGQRQRIGLARAFYGDRRLIVLDEPNANLDPDGEEALARAVEAATERGKIVVVVTHRMSILSRLSHAAIVQDGRIVRFGAARQVFEAVAQPIAGATTGRDPKVAFLKRGGRIENADGGAVAGGRA